jgi:hypothetical protein
MSQHSVHLRGIDLDLKRARDEAALVGALWRTADP